jgi:D-glycero-alpha-D-manno-heptose 1-phosphate guanylyltransferase
LDVIILAGGLGTRLRPVLPDIPKVLAPIGERSFLEFLLERLQRQGIGRFVLSVGFRHALIEEAVGTAYKGVPIQYAIEAEPLGTGGAIRFAATYCHGDDVVVLNGDSYVDVDLRRFVNMHQRNHARLSVCAVEVENAARYGRILVDGSRIVGFSEKGTVGPGLINAGVYVMRRDLLDSLALPAAFSFEEEILAVRVAEIEPRVFRVTGTFIDIGIPEDYSRARLLLGSG